MGRTTKDIIIDRTAEEIKAIVQTRFKDNKVKTTESSPDSIKGRRRTGFLTAPKFLKVTFCEDYRRLETKRALILQWGYK